MKQTPDDSLPIGEQIRKTVIPEGMSVTDAAKMLGVGRPALSNLLNGRAALSPTMAARLERVFGANAEALLQRQNVSKTTSISKTLSTSLVPVRQVPHVAKITACDISDWGLKIEARQLLPVLIRKLISPLGDAINEINFPGYDSSQALGWDGWLETTSASPWVPVEKSGWELGCNRDPARKANDDFRKRTQEIAHDIQLDTTYVFATPHIWPQKDDWASKAAKSSSWKAVRALDARDIEVWLEHSLQAQIFMCECLNRNPVSYQSLESVWAEWAQVTEPSMPQSLFSGAMKSCKQKLMAWLSNPPGAPFILVADTRIEGLAFLAAAFSADEDFSKVEDRAVVVCDKSGSQSLSETTDPAIAIVADDFVEESIANLPRRHHTIIVRNKSLLNDDADFSLDVLNSIEFDEALRAIEIDPAEIDRLSSATGGSRSVLRRQWATIPAIRKPAWASDRATSDIVSALVLVGAWDSNSDADQTILSYVSNYREYADIEREIAWLQSAEDSPLWSILSARGVASKIDALFATAHMITTEVIDRFFEAAELVLSEDDPSLDLPEDDRWMAAFHNKVREHSPILRRSIRESLILLAIYSERFYLLSKQNMADRVNELIQKLLAPLTIRRLESYDEDMRFFAEAAPETFLSTLEEDLNQPKSQVCGLIRPTNPGPFSRSYRTGLLWALEVLAWSPKHLDRVVAILAQLSMIPLDDNQVNKPINSLQSFFRFWMPQTSAPLEQRKTALTRLAETFPEIAWQIAIKQVGNDLRSGSYNCRPTWRTDSHGAGAPILDSEAHQFRWHALDMILSWESYSWRMLAELADHTPNWPNEQQENAWKIIENWAETAPDEEKAKLKESIRRHLNMTARIKKTPDSFNAKLAWRSMQYLTPESLIEKHRWLFEGHWLPESADEFSDEKFDWRERDRRTFEARQNAAAELYSDGGLEALYDVTSGSDSPQMATSSLAPTLSLTERADLICTIFGDHSPNVAKLYVYGLTADLDDSEQVRELAASVLINLNLEQQVEFLKCLPIRRETWELDAFSDETIAQKYWQEISIKWNRLDEYGLAFVIEKFLSAGRPLAAFHAADHEWDRVGTNVIERILRDMARFDGELTYDALPAAYSISEALKELDKREDISAEQTASIEFAYLGVLRHDYDFPNVKNLLANDPAFFVEALIWTYKRKDGQADEERFTDVDEERRASMAETCYSLLDHADTLPGFHQSTLDEKRTSCLKWVTEVRRKARAVGRLAICDDRLGAFFAKSPVGEDGIWPHEAVRDVLEMVHSDEIKSGFYVGVLNRRDTRVSMPYEGGDQERSLANKYKDWADSLALIYPYTAELLHEIEDHYLRDAKREDEQSRLRSRLQRH